jgi:hypothetical protein
MTGEQAIDDPTVGLTWFKSSYSDSEGANCIEVGVLLGSVHVRNSRDQKGPILSFDYQAWAAFVGFAAAFEV